MTTESAVEIIKTGSIEALNQVVSDMISSNQYVEEYTRKRYAEYAGRVPIELREFQNEMKLNNKLKNDFRGDIVDSITGYLYAKPVRWELKQDAYSEAERKKIHERIRRFQKLNNVAELDLANGEDAAITGRAYRLLYIDLNGEERVMRLRPWEVVVAEDSTLDEVTHALIYYDTVLIKNGGEVTIRKAEFYDKSTVTYLAQKEGGRFEYDPDQPVNPKPHLFDGVPVIEIRNNNLLVSDFEKVDSLIDAYDRALSDVQNEIEEFRLAYLAFFGVEPTAESIMAARQTGAFGMDIDEDVRFITKDLNVEAIRDHKETLEKNIYLFSKTVNMTDEKFSGGQQSGDSRRWKLMSMENRAIAKESKFRKALQRQLQLLAGVWGKKGMAFDYIDIDFVFTRNVPEERIYLAEIASKLTGIASEETVLSFVPGVEDPKKELEQKRREEKERALIEGAAAPPGGKKEVEKQKAP